MAIYHLRAKVVQRSNGQSAVAAAAYRAGERLYDDRRETCFDYSRKQGVVHTEILAPEGAEAWVFDRQTLWNQSERSETRKNSQVAREVEVAIPRELDRDARIELVRSFAREQFVAHGMVADIAVHIGTASDGGEHPHGHILLSLRELDGDRFGAKNRDWNENEMLQGWRAAWTEYANAALERMGSAERIDHRTLEAQGITRKPEPARGLANHVRELIGGIRERFNQWVAIKHRHWMERELAHIDPGDPQQSADLVQRLSAYAREVTARVRGREEVQEMDLGYER